MPKVSVVIPTYNREEFIGQVVSSVLAQTETDFEILIVDDGSTDSSANRAATLVEANKHLRVLQHAKNKGAQAARNTGIDAASGEWIAFLDSDDQLLPDSLEVRLRKAAEAGVEVVHSECLLLDLESSTPRPFGIPPLSGSVYRSLLENPGPAFPGFLVSKRALEQIGGLDESIVAYQEWDTAIRLARYYDFAFVSQPTFVYDCRHTNALSKDLLRSARGYEQVITKHRWPIVRHLGWQGLVRHFTIMSDLYRRADDHQTADGYLVKANRVRAFDRWRVSGYARRVISLLSRS